MVLNAAIAIGLAPFVGYIAAAIGTTLTGWAMVLQLWLGARGMGEAAKPDDRFRRRIWRIIAAALAMGVVLFASEVVISPFYGMAGWRYVALAISVVIGMASYVVFAAWFGALRLSDIKGAMRRGGGAGA